MSVHNIELRPGAGGQLARSAGTFCTLVKKGEWKGCSSGAPWAANRSGPWLPSGCQGCPLLSLAGKPVLHEPILHVPPAPPPHLARR